VERFIKLTIGESGNSLCAGTIKIPVEIDGNEPFKMNYENDLVLSNGKNVKGNLICHHK